MLKELKQLDATILRQRARCKSLQQHLQPVHSRSNQFDIRADSIWQQLTAKWATFFAFGLAASIEDNSWCKQKFSNDQDELQPALSQASHHKGFLNCLKDKDVNRRETAKSSVIICDFTISRKSGEIFQTSQKWSKTSSSEAHTPRKRSFADLPMRAAQEGSQFLQCHNSRHRNRTNQLVTATSSWLPGLLLATVGGKNAGCVLHRSFCVAPSRDFEFNVIHGRTKSPNNPRYCRWNLSKCACAATSHTIDPKAAKAWHQTALILQPSTLALSCQPLSRIPPIYT